MGRQRRWPTAKQVAYLLVLPLMSASSVSWALEADISGVDGRVLVNIEAYLENIEADQYTCLLYTSPSPRDKRQSRMPSSA